jgi:hypothetical protein
MRPYPYIHVLYVIVSEWEAELFITHAQALERNIADDARRAGKCRARLDNVI